MVFIELISILVKRKQTQKKTMNRKTETEKKKIAKSYQNKSIKANQFKTIQREVFLNRKVNKKKYQIL